MVADWKEFKRALRDISVFLSTGAAFLLSSFLIPGVSKRRQILCWQTAMVAFFAAGVIIRRHPVVWYPIFLRWTCRRRDRKPKPPFTPRPQREEPAKPQLSARSNQQIV